MMKVSQLWKLMHNRDAGLPRPGILALEATPVQDVATRASTASQARAMQCTVECIQGSRHGVFETCQEMYSAEEGGEEEGTAHVQVCERVALETVQQDCYGALEDALQVYSQLCSRHSMTDQSLLNRTLSPLSICF